MSKLSVAIHGAGGRMGQRLVHLIQASADLMLTSALESPTSPLLGRDIGEVCGLGSLGVPVVSNLPLGKHLDVLIDFSVPAATLAILPVCVDRRIPIVVATTGFTPAQRAEIEAAAHQTAVLFAPNMSLSVNVLFQLVKQAAALLVDKDFDIEIIERHHRFKHDAPSGTALQLARIIQEQIAGLNVVHGRQGLLGERPRHEIGMHALRVGDNVGEHTVVFSTLGETLELSHKGHTRDSYARGALLAASFLAGKPAGRYSMNDVLGI